MALRFPPGCDTPPQRTEFLYRLQEKLRLAHNVQGARFRAGQITEQQWNDWLETVWNPRSDRVVEGILRMRHLIAGRKPGTYTPRWEPDVSDAD